MLFDPLRIRESAQHPAKCFERFCEFSIGDGSTARSSKTKPGQSDRPLLTGGELVESVKDAAGPDESVQSLKQLPGGIGRFCDTPGVPSGGESCIEN